MKALPITLLLTSSLAFAAEEATSLAPDKSAPAKPVGARFLADGVDDHIVAMKRRIAINKQERCPFGLYQIPGKTPIITGSITKKTRKTPFSEFVNEIQISVINAKEREFLVGARIFRLGQIFPIIRGGEKLSVRVESVTPSNVVFKNVATGELAKRRLDVLPEGISTAGGKVSYPGITPKGRGEAAPLHLDFNSPPSRP